MKTKVLEDNRIGFELTNIADVAKARELGLCIQSEHGFTYDYPQEFTNEDGNDEERDPTDTEIYQRIQDGLADGDRIFATLQLDNDTIVPNAATTLQTDFRIGQTVYTMHDNRITQGEIVYLSLSRYDDRAKLYVDSRARNLVSNVYDFCAYKCHLGTPSYYDLPASDRKRIEDLVMRAINDCSAVIKVGKDAYMARNLEDIFATKQELADSLMSEI